MSWIAGILDAGRAPALRARLRTTHPPPAFVLEDADLYLAAGGPAGTCRFGHFADGGGWALAGLGLHPADGQTALLSTDAWAGRLVLDPPALDDLDGHFAVVTWRRGRLGLYTDRPGLRSLYLARSDDALLFSTRLDWTARLSGRRDVDLAALGAHWLAFNQLRPHSLVHGIDRLVQGAAAHGLPGGPVHHTPPTGLAEPSGPAPADLLAPLAGLLRPALPAPQQLSLGLSGGLDSRLLLALLLQPGDAAPGFALHVFGDPADPDVRLSRRIARAQRLPQEHLSTTMPSADEALRLLHDYAAQTCATTPASACVKLSAYDTLHAQQKVVIDGGFGEIGRRQFFNRLSTRGGRALRQGRPEALLPHLRARRADLFTPEATARLWDGFRDDLATLLPTLPPVDDVGLANVLEHLALRTRLPHFYGYGQARLDAQAVNYMPFAQPSFLRAVLQAPVRERAGGRRYRQAIRRRAPALTRYPLVKGGTTYPFPLTTLPAWAWTHVKARLQPPYRDRTTAAFLHLLADYTRDLVRDPTTRAFTAYDPARLQALVDGFYAGDTALAPAVDWWLAFETWRRSLSP